MTVGTNVGDISLWEVSSREKLVSRNFQVWNIEASSMMLKVLFPSQFMIAFYENKSYQHYYLIWMTGNFNQRSKCLSKANIMEP